MLETSNYASLGISTFNGESFFLKHGDYFEELLFLPDQSISAPFLVNDALDSGELTLLLEFTDELLAA